MSSLSIGDLAQSFMLRRQTGSLKNDLQILSQEMTTGVAADIGRQTRGDLAPLGALAASLSQLRAFKVTTTEAALFTDTMQTALAVVDAMASDLAPDLLQLAKTSPFGGVDSIAIDANQKFRAAVAALNTKLGDRSLFGGKNTQNNALADANSILAALDLAIAGDVSAADVARTLDDWFDSPAGYDAIAYQGADPLAPLQIAAGDFTQITVTAADSGIRNTLKGLAMAALLERGALSATPVARSDLARLAGESLISSQADRAQMAAGLAVIENRISAAQARNGAEITSLEIARTRIVSVDPYETATKLQETQTQLETLYAITARLSRLNLMDFL